DVAERGTDRFLVVDDQDLRHGTKMGLRRVPQRALPLRQLGQCPYTAGGSAKRSRTCGRKAAARPINGRKAHTWKMKPMLVWSAKAPRNAKPMPAMPKEKP